MNTTIKFLENISDVSKDDLTNMLKKNDSPFISFDFLNALEKSDSVEALTGVNPMPIGLA